jgi:glutamine amidotransferase PdxT
MSAMQDPKVQMVIQQSMGQNPQALAALQAAMSAHINEHLGYEYRKQIEQTMGMDIPNYGEDDTDNQVTIPEAMEVQISKLAAQASQQLLQQNQQEAQAQQNQQKAQDPLIQMQQQELQLKAQDLQRKVAKDQSDAQLEAMKIQVDRERIGAQQQSTGAQISAKMQDTQAQLRAKQDEMAAKLGVDVALKESEHAHHKQQTNQQHDHARFLAERQAQMAERQAQKQPKREAK